MNMPATPPAAAAAPLSPQTLARFDAIRREYPVEMKTSMVMPLLYCIQAERGHLTEADAVTVAKFIGMPTMPVMEALSWYTMFNKAPQGRHVVKVCRNIACALRGSEDLIVHMSKTLGIQPGQTTPDGRITLQTVECLASCGTAPAMQINDTYHEQLDAATVDRILKDLP